MKENSGVVYRGRRARRRGREDAVARVGGGDPTGKRC